MSGESMLVCGVIVVVRRVRRCAWGGGCSRSVGEEWGWVCQVVCREVVQLAGEDWVGGLLCCHQRGWHGSAERAPSEVMRGWDIAVVLRVETLEVVRAECWGRLCRIVLPH